MGRPETKRVSRMSGSAQAKTLAERAYAILEEMIVTLVLAPGCSVSESELAKKLNIGRTPIREALQRLAMDKLVTIHPSRGVFVSEINVKTQLLLLETRRALECLIARSASRRATPEERATLRDIADGMDKAARVDDDVGFMRHDRMLNELIAAATHNEFTEAAMSRLHSLSRRFWFAYHKRVADLPLTAQLHAALARAIASGNAEDAERSVERLLDYVEESTRASLSLET